MILELRKMELDEELIIHFISISGKRMIAQGTDGVSRADLSSGVMGGEDFLKYLPLDETAIERQKGLSEELLSRPGKKRWKVATTEDWFDAVFTSPNERWIWCPPPALVKLAVK